MNSAAGQVLYQSIVNEDLESVNLQLNNGITNLEERDQDGQTFLMIACQLGNHEIVQRLLQEPGTDVNAVDNDNWTALLNAAKQGSSKVVCTLLDAGADLEHRDLGSWTALMWACYRGSTDVAIELLMRDANPNVKGEHHMSCLTWAAGRGHTRIVRELLTHGAKVNTADKYGTTPLIWTSRKGHAEIVDMLLREGAIVDKAGMNSWTALTVATTGGYTDVVRLLLAHHPYVNAVDKDGYTALAIAAKEGFTEIVNLLLQKEAYVNIPDRYGDTILIHAIKGNHVEIARALLKKYADVDVQGVDDKTALYWAVEKGYVLMTKLVLEFQANTEISNKDGDTPLLKAVRKRNLDLVQLLIDSAAKVSACDKKGDNALHISVRGRSKRVTECLLRNPKNARLLYNKNKNAETAYEIDATHDRSVLTQVFGARNLNSDDNLQGYELFSSAIADVLSEPSLRTPITVGLFARWGSGKSFLLSRLRKEMETFSLYCAEVWFEFTLLQFFVSFTFSVIAGLALGIGLSWPIGLGVGGGLLLLQYVFLASVWYGANRREWISAKTIGRYVAKKMQFLKLFLQLVFCNVPVQTNRDVSAIRFLFTDNAHLNSLTGEKSITGIIATLCDALEHEYGILVPRLYRIFKPRKAIDHGRFKSLCCVPYFLVVLLILSCCVAILLLVAIFGFNSFTTEPFTVVYSIVIALAIVVGLAILGNVYTWSRMIIHVAIPTRRHVQKIAQQLDVIKMDGFIQLLKKEVDTIGRMTRCMDAFTGNHSRLVVIIDGLDSCEQDKLLHVLDMVHMLFGDTNSPFVTILAVDPHVIIKGIEHNLHSSFHESSINGHDYLRNIIQLPFFIQNQTVPKPPPRNLTRLELNVLDKPSDGGNPLASISVACHRQESCMSGASYLSLTDIGKSGKGRRQKQAANAAVGNNFGSTTLVRQPSMYDLSKSLGKSSYFSDINPRNMKRLMNILAITGRLLRAYNIDFNWYKLASWINLTEQWPYRLSWIILEVEDHGNDIEDTQSLKNVYDRVSPKIPSSKDVDPLVEIDRNVRKLEVFLTNSAPPMTVADMKRFLPCTINVDPYLRKLIRELQQNTENLNAEYGLYLNNIGSGFDQMGWPGSRPSCTGTLNPFGARRQIQGGHASPRQTPTRPYSSLLQSAASNSGAMFPGSSMLLNPMMHQMYMQMLEMQQLQQQQQQQVAVANLKTEAAAHPKIKINVRGGIGKKPLSAMSLDDIVDLVQRIEGLNNQMVPEYVNRMKLNNIAGLVLLCCDLSELKPVMQMSFGDWELFQGLIQTLRDRETSGLSSGDEAKPQFVEADVISPGHVKFTQSATGFDIAVEMPKATYPPGAGGGAAGLNPNAKRVMSDLPASRATSSATEFGSSSSSATNFRRSGANERQGNERQLRSEMEAMKQQQQQQAQQMSQLMLNRQDSFVNEVMMESEALRDFIEATVDSSGSETEEPTEREVQRGISPIPEEAVGHDMSRHSSVVSLVGSRVMSRRASQESSNPGDKVFLVGPDDDSGESDSSEVERLSRKSSTVRRPTPKSPQKSHTTLIDHNSNPNNSQSSESIVAAASSDVGKVSRASKSAQTRSSQRKVFRADESQTAPLIPIEGKYGSNSSLKTLPINCPSPLSHASRSASSSYQESHVKKFLGQESRSLSSKAVADRLSLHSPHNFSGSSPNSASAFAAVIPSCIKPTATTFDEDSVLLNIESDPDTSDSPPQIASRSSGEAQVKIVPGGAACPRVTYVP